MQFTALGTRDRIEVLRKEFTTIVRSIFEKPELLKPYITDNKLSNEQSKIILRKINTLNSKTCACCRRFDSRKLQLAPIDPELEPIIDIARTIAQAKLY